MDLNRSIEMGLDNENPTLFEKSEERKVNEKDYDDNETEEFDSREIFGKLFFFKRILFDF